MFTPIALAGAMITQQKVDENRAYLAASRAYSAEVVKGQARFEIRLRQHEERQQQLDKEFDDVLRLIRVLFGPGVAGKADD